eukprot:7958403-Heterocapsa_arctica.AAC.1
MGPARPSYQQATGVRHSVFQNVARKVAQCGPCPSDHDTQQALEELLRAKDLYAQEPKNLAPFCAKKLKILRGNVNPKDAKELLPPAMRKYLM